MTEHDFLPPDPETVEMIRAALPNRGPATAPECPRCGPTARAISLVQAQWIVAGIDKGET